MHSYTLQRVQPSGDLFLLEYDEQDEIVAVIPNVNADALELLHDIESGNMPSTLDLEWHDNAEWAQEQRWGFPLTAADL